MTLPREFHPKAAHSAAQLKEPDAKFVASPILAAFALWRLRDLVLLLRNGRLGRRGRVRQIHYQSY